MAQTLMSTKTALHKSREFDDNLVAECRQRHTHAQTDGQVENNAAVTAHLVGS